MYSGILQSEVLTYSGDDIVNGYGLTFAVHNLAYNALCQFQVDLFVVYSGMGHNGDDNTFQVANAVAHILGYVVNDLRWELQTVAVYFVAQNVFA